MSVVTVVLAIMAMAATFAVTLLVAFIIMRSARQASAKLPADVRRRTRLLGAVNVAILLAAALVMVAQPFGRPTILIVIGGYAIAEAATIGIYAKTDPRRAGR